MASAAQGVRLEPDAACLLTFAPSIFVSPFSSESFHDHGSHPHRAFPDR